MTRNPYPDGGPDRGPPKPSLQVSYDLDADEKPSSAVVMTVATLTDTSPLELEPLYEVVDPDHLDGVFRNVDGDSVGTKIEFTYTGCEVTVTHAEVRVRATEEEL